MNKEDQLFTVYCVHCGEHQFKISRNLLEEMGCVMLVCPECKRTTQVELNGPTCVTIKVGR